MKKINSVKVKILTFLTLLIIVYSILLFIFIDRSITKKMMVNSTTDLVEEQDSLNLEIDTINNQVKDVADWFKSSLEADWDYLYDSEKYDAFCESAIYSFGLTNVALIDTDGEQFSSYEYGFPSLQETVDRALEGDEIYNLYKVGYDLYSIAALPVYSDGEIQCAVICESRITNDDFIANLADFVGLDVAVINDYAYTYSSVQGAKWKEVEERDQVDKALSGESVIFQRMIMHVPYIINFFPIENKDGEVLSVGFLAMEVSQVKGLIKSVIGPLAIYALLLTCFLIGVMITLLELIVLHPLHLINDAIAGLSSGDADLTARLEVRGKDEFTDVQNNVNKFMAELQGIMLKLNDAENSLKLIGENLGSNAQESASATGEIMATIESVRNQSKTQSASVTETTGVLDVSQNNVGELVSLINKQVAGITDNSAAIEEMIQNITSVTNNVRKMSDSFKTLGENVSNSNVKIENVGHRVSEMADQSKTLMQANSMIAQVASQTNLLAMNAAIEAAHAGEAGKGFSVVADEIRKLAETSSAQSKHINAELKEISNSIQDVVGLSSDSQESFGAIVDQLEVTDQIMNQIANAMDEQSQASNQILDSLGEMKDQSMLVNDKSKGLKDCIENVQGNMTGVNQISDKILGSMDEMAAGSQQINTAAQGVAELALQTKQNIDILSELLGKFKM